jgi:hypothetical protein
LPQKKKFFELILVVSEKETTLYKIFFSIRALFRRENSI